MVLLKNSVRCCRWIPPRRRPSSGRSAKDQHDMLGPWWGQGKDTDAVTLYDGIKAQSPGATTPRPARGEHRAAGRPRTTTCAAPPTDFAAAVDTAKAADQVVLALGENREMSGEAAARSTLDLPGYQQQLINAIKATGKPFVVVLFNGRPLTLDGGRAGLAGHPRGVVPRHSGRERRGRRPVRQGQPGREAAGLVPAGVGQVPDLLQPRADRAARATSTRSTTRVTATCPPARRCTSSGTG